MTTPRLHIDAALIEGGSLDLEGPRVHYLAHVLRLRARATLHLFNAADGEFVAQIERIGRHDAVLVIGARCRSATPEPGPTLFFAPIRQNRMDWLVEKATELGVEALQPVLTRNTVVRLARTERLQAIAIEAAEQCGRLSVPRLADAIPVSALGETVQQRRLLFADESGDAAPLGRSLSASEPVDLLIGPEGGFTADERAMLRALPQVTPVSLGPRILRAETAALTGLALIAASVDRVWCYQDLDDVDPVTRNAARIAAGLDQA